MQRPDRQPLAIAHCPVLHTLFGCGVSLLAPFAFPSKRKGREKGYGQDSDGFTAGFLRYASHLLGGDTRHYADGLLHREFAIAHLHDVHSRLRLERTYHMAQVGRCTHQFPRYHLLDTQQRNEQWRCHTDTPARYLTDGLKRIGLLALFGAVQAGHTAIFHHHLYEVDFPFFYGHDLALGMPRTDRTGHKSLHRDLSIRTGFPHRVLHIHHLFSHPSRTETYPSDVGQHVLVCATHHRRRDQHLYRHGQPDMAEGVGSADGIRRRGNGELQQKCKPKVTTLPHFLLLPTFNFHTFPSSIAAKNHTFSTLTHPPKNTLFRV